MATNGGPEAAECDVKIDFDSGKGKVLEIWQAWKGRGRQGSSRVGV